jgi:hypothetical protein
MIETVHKDFTQLNINKHNEIKTIENYTIDFTITYNTLNPMLKDIVKLLKDKNISSISLTTIDDTAMPKIIKKIIHLEHINTITIGDYYLKIDNDKIFFNNIFNFKGV